MRQITPGCGHDRSSGHTAKPPASRQQRRRTLSRQTRQLLKRIAAQQRRNSRRQCLCRTTDSDQQRPPRRLRRDSTRWHCRANQSASGSCVRYGRTRRTRAGATTAPAFASRAQAAEISENYWMALLRDLPYSQYSANVIANAAAADLTLYGNDFDGPKNGGAVTTSTLFRGLTPGDLLGPYLSQFFYQDCNFGANKLEQKITTTAPGINYMTDFDTWLAVQRGISQPPDVFDPVPRYMRNGRDIGQWVHIDVLFQGYFHAFLVLAGAGAPFDDGNPYNNNPSQIGFGTFGGPHIATLLCEVSTRALKAVWFQKWFVHRRLRPEVQAERVHRTLFDGANYPVHPEIHNSFSDNNRLKG